MILNKQQKEDAHFYANLQKIQKNEHLSSEAIAERSGLDIKVFNQILNRALSPRGYMIQDIAHAVQVSPYTLCNLKLPYKMNEYRICMEKRLNFKDHIVAHSNKLDPTPRKMFYMSASVYITFHIYQEGQELFFGKFPISTNWVKLLNDLLWIIPDPENGYEIKYNIERAKRIENEYNLHITFTIDDTALTYGTFGYNHLSVPPLFFRNFLVDNYDKAVTGADLSSHFYRSFPTVIIPTEKVNVNRIASYLFNDSEPKIHRKNDN